MAREYSEYNPDTGQTEIWSTDDAGNFSFVGNATPEQSAIDQQNISPAMQGATASYGEGGQVEIPTTGPTTFDANAYSQSLIGGLPKEWQQAYNEANQPQTKTYPEQRPDGSIWEISYNPANDQILGERQVTSASMLGQNQPAFQQAVGQSTLQPQPEPTMSPFQQALMPVDYGLGRLQQTQYQGPMGTTYPAQPSFQMGTGVLANSPIGGATRGSPPIRYQYGYEASPNIQRHETGHANVGTPYAPGQNVPDPNSIDWSTIPDWALEWAITGGNTSGLAANKLYDSTTGTVINPTELAANLYAMGYWNPVGHGIGSSSE